MISWLLLQLVLVWAYLKLVLTDMSTVNQYYKI